MLYFVVSPNYLSNETLSDDNMAQTGREVTFIYTVEILERWRCEGKQKGYRVGTISFFLHAITEYCILSRKLVAPQFYKKFLA